MANRGHSISVRSVMREVDKEQLRKTINHFINTSFVSLPGRASATAVAHLSVLQGLSCDLQQSCIYGVAHNLWQSHAYNKVSRQRWSLFNHSDLRAGSCPFRITSPLSIIVKHCNYMTSRFCITSPLKLYNSATGKSITKTAGSFSQEYTFEG